MIWLLARCVSTNVRKMINPIEKELDSKENADRKMENQEFLQEWIHFLRTKNYPPLTQLSRAQKKHTPCCSLFFLSSSAISFLLTSVTGWLCHTKQTSTAAAAASTHPPTHLPTQPREEKTRTSKAKKCSKTVNCKRCANKAFGDCRWRRWGGI